MDPLLLHCARVPEALPPQAIDRLLDRLAADHATDLRQRLAMGSGTESAVGLALLASCGRVRPLPPLATLQRPDRAKPAWPGGPDFSISHAGGFAACAVAPMGISIGIDLEPAGRLPARALRLVLTDAEKRLLEEGADPTGLWTCKEAVLKAAGAGLAEMRRAEIDGTRGLLDGRSFHLQQHPLAGDLVLAIASSAPLPTAQARWLDADALFPDGDLEARL